MSRTAFGDSRSIYSFDGDWGNDDSWGANSPYDYFERFDRDRRTLSEDLRLVSRASVERRRGVRLARRASTSLRTDEDVTQRDVWRDKMFGDGETPARQRLPRHQPRRLRREWNGASRRPRCCRVGVRGENRSADYHDTDGAAFSPDETMFGGSLSLRHDFSARTQRLPDIRARLQGRRLQHRRRRCPARHRSFVAETLHNFEARHARVAAKTATLAGDVAFFYMRRYDQQVPYR